jgi:CheY-like chemotaxis protein
LGAYVVILDDDQDDIDLLNEAIQERDNSINVTIFTCPVIALEALTSQLTLIPEYIFLDINMPKKSGDDFIRELRRRADFQEVVVAAMSTGMTQELSRALLDCGADHAFKKPAEFSGYSKILTQVFH